MPGSAMRVNGNSAWQMPPAFCLRAVQKSASYTARRCQPAVARKGVPGAEKDCAPWPLYALRVMSLADA